MIDSFLARLVTCAHGHQFRSIPAVSTLGHQHGRILSGSLDVRMTGMELIHISRIRRRPDRANENGGLMHVARSFRLFVVTRLHPATLPVVRSAPDRYASEQLSLA